MDSVFRSNEQLPAGSKRCVKCHVIQPLENFYAQASMKDGYRNDCKSCMSAYRKKRYATNPEKSIERVQQWRNENPDKYREGQRRYRLEHGERRRERDRAGHLHRKYGLTQADYEFLVTVQSGLCAICGQEDEKGLHIDHEHATGLVRGLLCGRCNKAIGLLDEDPARFESAKDYLSRLQLPLACGDRRKAA